MEGFVKGDVVIIPFPFSDLSGSKKRPAFVLADLPGDDIILCQITSQSPKGNLSVPLLISDFLMGSLPVNSFIRPSRIFTADKKIILSKAGTVRSKVSEEAIKTIISLFQQSAAK